MEESNLKRVTSPEVNKEDSGLTGITSDPTIQRENIRPCYDLQVTN